PTNPKTYWGNAFGARATLHDIKFGAAVSPATDIASDDNPSVKIDPASDYRSAASALAFALALQSIDGPRSAPVVFIEKAHEASQEGAVYPPGLGVFGVNPERALFVRVASDREALWAAEEALKVPASSGGGYSVVLFIRRPGRDVDLTATRRLHLAASAGGGRCLLVRGDGASSCAPYRWRAQPAISHPCRDDLDSPGLPAIGVSLEKGGVVRPASVLEWSNGTVRLRHSHDSQGMDYGVGKSRNAAQVYPLVPPQRTVCGIR
ncbi:MAG: hypothetical protein AAF986_08395, partial [Pseudomonadota bacterium]